MVVEEWMTFWFVNQGINSICPLAIKFNCPYSVVHHQADNCTAHYFWCLLTINKTGLYDDMLWISMWLQCPHMKITWTKYRVCINIRVYLLQPIATSTIQFKHSSFPEYHEPLCSQTNSDTGIPWASPRPLLTLLRTALKRLEMCSRHYPWFEVQLHCEPPRPALLSSLYVNNLAGS